MRYRTKQGEWRVSRARAADDYAPAAARSDNPEVVIKFKFSAENLARPGGSNPLPATKKRNHPNRAIP